MKSRKWVIGVLIGMMAALLCAGGVTVAVDPFFHYHAPLKGLSYEFEDEYETYMNDGIAKHFDYDALISGTSMTTNFKMEEIDELFGVKSVRLTMQGEGFKRLNENIVTAIDSNPDLKLVIRGIDDMWFISDPEYEGRDEYPTYLYDDILWNDVKYLYNADIFLNLDVPVLQRTIQGIPTEKLDDFGFGTDENGTVEEFLANYERPEKRIMEVTQEETDQYFDMLERNLQQNVISIMQENPEIMFYIFFPPYSICWWDELNQYGTDVLKRRIDLEEFAINKILSCDNVRLFSFHNNFDLVCDLGYYIDNVHYNKNINSQILRWMKDGKYELTKENYGEYIEEITNFYCNFDYDAFFSEPK